MATDQKILDLNKNLAEAFRRRDFNWKRVPSGSSVLLQYGQTDIYLFIGTYSKSKPQFYRISLCTNNDQIIKQLEGNYGSQAEFGNHKIFNNEYLPIRHVSHEGNLLEITNSKGLNEAEKIVLKKYDEDWADLTDRILDLI